MWRIGSMWMVGGRWGGWMGGGGEQGSSLDNIFSLRRWCSHLDRRVLQLLSSFPACVAGLSSPLSRIKETKKKKSALSYLPELVSAFLSENHTADKNRSLTKAVREEVGQTKATALVIAPHRLTVCFCILLRQALALPCLKIVHGRLSQPFA